MTDRVIVDATFLFFLDHCRHPDVLWNRPPIRDRNVIIPAGVYQEFQRGDDALPPDDDYVVTQSKDAITLPNSPLSQQDESILEIALFHCSDPIVLTDDSPLVRLLRERDITVKRIAALLMELLQANEISQTIYNELADDAIDDLWLDDTIITTLREKQSNTES